ATQKVHFTRGLIWIDGSAEHLEPAPRIRVLHHIHTAAPRAEFSALRYLVIERWPKWFSKTSPSNSAAASGPCASSACARAMASSWCLSGHPAAARPPPS